MTNKYYAGIGSRKTPDNILRLMTEIAVKLSEDEWILRSGAADGADTAFHKGATDADIFLPWKHFNDSDSELYEVAEEAFELAKNHHPAWDNLGLGAKSLLARNIHQILGRDIGNDSPSRFVICWTPGGKIAGGTGLAIRVAQTYNVPVYNLAKKEIRDRMWKYVNRDN